MLVKCYYVLLLFVFEIRVYTAVTYMFVWGATDVGLCGETNAVCHRF